jgi:hypothetical protein
MIYQLFLEELLENEMSYCKPIDENNLPKLKHLLQYKYNFPEALQCIYAYCCFKDKRDIIKWLEAQYQIKPSYSAVDNAISGGHLNLVKEFHNRGFRGLHGLYLAVAANNATMADYLFSEGYRWDQQELMDLAKRRNLKDSLKWINKMGFQYEHEL